MSHCIFKCYCIFPLYMLVWQDKPKEAYALQGLIAGLFLLANPGWDLVAHGELLYVQWKSPTEWPP